ncbi:MAG: hypothetical protein WKF83_12425 [Nocardioidaceae bacterium]
MPEVLDAPALPARPAGGTSARRSSYRRFFDVDTLDRRPRRGPGRLRRHPRGCSSTCIGAASLDGFRIDHPDGLADPERLPRRGSRDATDGAWVVVEKILEADERCRTTWRVRRQHRLRRAAAWCSTARRPGRPVTRCDRPVVRGRAATCSLHDVAAGRPSGRCCDQLLHAGAATGWPRSPSGQPADAGRAVADAVRLRRRAASSCSSHVDVYRAYVPTGPAVVDEASTPLVDAAARRARAHGPSAGPRGRAGAARAAACATPRPTSPAGRDLVVRFQQTCGPVMAKGVEDTTFYRWHRARRRSTRSAATRRVCTTRAPGGAARLGAYQQARRPARTAMTTLSTHDTKRSEDVRARLARASPATPSGLVCSAGEQVRAARRPTPVSTRRRRTSCCRRCVGTWPIDRRAAATATSSRRPARPSSRTTLDRPRRRRTRPASAASPDRLRRRPPASHAARGGDCCAPPRRRSRGHHVGAKLAAARPCPACPTSTRAASSSTSRLVDPDNRRPVDFDERQRRPARLDAGARPRDLHDEQLLVTARALTSAPPSVRDLLATAAT